ADRPERRRDGSGAGIRADHAGDAGVPEQSHGERIAHPAAGEGKPKAVLRVALGGEGRAEEEQDRGNDSGMTHRRTCGNSGERGKAKGVASFLDSTIRPAKNVPAPNGS